MNTQSGSANLRSLLFLQHCCAGGVWNETYHKNHAYVVSSFNVGKNSHPDGLIFGRALMRR